MSNNFLTRRWGWIVLNAEEKSKNITLAELPNLSAPDGHTEVLVVLEWHPRYCDLFDTRIASGLSEAQLSFDLRSSRTSLSHTFIGTDVRAIGLR